MNFENAICVQSKKSKKICKPTKIQKQMKINSIDRTITTPNDSRKPSLLGIYYFGEKNTEQLQLPQSCQSQQAYVQNQQFFSDKSQLEFQQSPKFNSFKLIAQEKFEDYSSKETPEAFVVKTPTLQQLQSFYQEMKENEQRLDWIEVAWKQNSNLDYAFRSKLIEWIMELAKDCQFTKETCQQACFFLDKYLHKNKNVQINELQKIALVAVYIAAKKEVIVILQLIFCQEISINKLLCNFRLEVEEYNKIEIEILQKLEWRLCPQTLNNSTDICTLIWDKFIEGSNHDCYLINSTYFRDNYLYFRSSHLQYFYFNNVLKVKLNAVQSFAILFRSAEYVRGNSIFCE